MLVKFIILLSFLLPGLAGCGAAQTMDVGQAYETARQGWQTNRHAVWEIDWPNAPLGGTVTAESWRADSRYRFEILEAAAPALIGQTLVSDGETVWRYNRLDPPPTFLPAKPSLSPVTDAMALIEQQLAEMPRAATRKMAQLNLGLAQNLVLDYADGNRLVVWLDAETGLPLRIQFWVNGQQGQLDARSSEPLVDPPPALFSVGAWLRSR